MDNYINANEYAENEPWLSVSEPIVRSESAADEQNPDTVLQSKNKNKKCVTAPVLTAQLVLCMLFLIAAFCAKSFLSDFFQDFMKAYNKEINASVYFSGDFSQFDYSGFFEASTDEV